MNNDDTNVSSQASTTEKDEDIKISADASTDKHPLKGQENRPNKKTVNIKKALSNQHCCLPPELH